MKLIPVDAIPKVNGYHKLQELIEEFVKVDLARRIIRPRQSVGLVWRPPSNGQSVP